MAPKGVSKENKLKFALEYLHDSAEPWTMKDLIAKLPKSKGIISQAVEEVIMELVNDDLVTKEKIGAGAFFWSFPSQAAATQRNKRQRIATELQQQQQRQQQLEQKRDAAVADGRVLDSGDVDDDNNNSRRERKQQLLLLQKKKAAVQQQLLALADCDPEAMEKLKKATDVCREAANRWGDNIESSLSVLRTKMDKSDAEMRKNFKLKDEYESI